MKNAPLTTILSAILSLATCPAQDTGPPLNSVTIGEKKYLAAEFVLDTPWVYPRSVAKFDTSIEDWKEPILLGGTVLLKHLSNEQCRTYYHGIQATDELLDAQRTRMTELYTSSNAKLTVKNVIIVIDPKTSNAELLIPHHTEAGVHYTSLIRIDHSWKIAAGTAAPSDILRNAAEITDGFAKKENTTHRRYPIRQLEAFTKMNVDSLDRKKPTISP